MDREQFSLVVESIYDCAFDRALWPQTLAEIASYLDCQTMRLFLFNNDAQRDGIGASIGIDTGFNQQFDGDIETLNSIKYGFVVAELDVALTLNEILGFNNGLDINGNKASDNRYYRNWMVPHGYHDALAALMVKNSAQFGGLAMTRGRGHPAFALEDRRKTSLLAPHIRRSLAISDMIEQKTIERDRLSAVIDALRTPIAIVDEASHVLHSNAAASKLMNEGDVVRTDREVLSAASRESRDDWARLVTTGQSSAQSISIRKPAGGDMIASIVPLSQPARSGKRGGSNAAIFFHDPDRQVLLPGEAFAKRYKLTGSELRLLLALARGATLQNIADASGVAISTVRSHLKSLLFKTGKSRQSELVQMALMSISP